MEKQKLSVVLAVYNEEENIEKCLSAVKKIADEIIIVDGESKDKTAAIAKQSGAKVIVTTNKPNFHINKQMAIEEAVGEWILQLDADEVVSKELADEIIEVINMTSKQIEERLFEPKKAKLFSLHQKLIEQRDGKVGTANGEVAAFFIPRRNNFLGHFITHAGTYPDGVIRLFKNGKAYLPCLDVHEQYTVDGKVLWLENDLLHYADPDLTHYLRRLKRYTDFNAQIYQDKSAKKDFISLLSFVTIKPLAYFVKLYIIHKGFLDGIAGFLFSLLSASQVAIGYIKYYKHNEK